MTITDYLFVFALAIMDAIMSVMLILSSHPLLGVGLTVITIIVIVTFVHTVGE